MNFAVITTTYKRPEELLRCIKSVEQQSCHHTHYIVNDSPDADYSSLEIYIKDKPQIVYIKNESNIGKNSSLNFVLEKLIRRDFDDYIIYVDDDDWLSDNCLEDFKVAIQSTPGPRWFVSKRSFENGKDITKNKTGRPLIRYVYDYLLRKRFSGDATHCISFRDTTAVRFPEDFKNGEEWIYFTQVCNEVGEFYFLDKTGTYTQGYLAAGVTNTYITPTFKKLIRASKKHNILSPLVVLYITARTIKHLFH